MYVRAKVLLVFSAGCNLAYLAWLVTHVHGPIGVLFFLAETLFISLGLFMVANHWKQEHVFHHPNRNSALSLDVFITCVNEPVSMIEATVRAASRIEYSPMRIFVLDDGGRGAVKKIADRYKAEYIARGTNEHSKAGNLNNGLWYSEADIVLALDADQVAEPQIAAELMDHFLEDPKIAIVATRQRFNVPEKDFNHDTYFYQHMQAGRNADNAAISCGSGVFYRRSALDAIGGFQTWNIVEDMYTSYVMHQFGYRTLYINKPYTTGTAPLDLRTIYKQRGTWATDTLRMFFKKSPLRVPGLTLKQRLHYTELAWSYIVSAIAVPVLFLMPFFASITSSAFTGDATTYLLFRLPSMVSMIYLFYEVSGNSLQSSQYWIGLSFVYLKSLVLALSPKKMKYRVTEKAVGEGKREIGLVVPHLVLIGLTLGGFIWRIYMDHGVTRGLLVNMFWFSFMIFGFAPVLAKAFAIRPFRLPVTKSEARTFAVSGE